MRKISLSEHDNSYIAATNDTAKTFLFNTILQTLDIMMNSRKYSVCIARISSDKNGMWEIIKNILI